MSLNINFTNENPIDKYTIKGTLINYDANPIQNVIIILKDLKNKFKLTTFSDIYGNFKFANLDKNSNFELFFLKTGLPNKKIKNIYFKSNNIICINLIYRNHLKMSCVKGCIFDEIENLPVKNIKIELFKVERCSKYLVYSSLSDRFGKFKIDNLDLGCYLLKLSSCNYFDKFYRLNVYKYNDFLKFKVYLTQKHINCSTKVYGKVTDDLGKPIENADVILYRTLKKILIPVLFTKTNTCGYYCFKNITLGTYLIKATKYS